MLRKRCLAPKADQAAAFKAFFECVLSEGFAVAWGCLLRKRWMVPVHGGAWVKRVPVGARGNEQEKGIGWMPWRQEAMKDVARCENPGEAASRR